MPAGESFDDGSHFREFDVALTGWLRTNWKVIAMALVRLLLSTSIGIASFLRPVYPAGDGLPMVEQRSLGRLSRV